VVGGLLVVGAAPQLVFGEEPTEVEDRFVFEPGYTVVVQRPLSEDEDGVRKALGEVRAAVQEVVDAEVTPDKLHNDAQRAQLEATLLVLFQDALSPMVVSRVALEHDCAALCGQRHRVKGKRKMP